MKSHHHPPTFLWGSCMTGNKDLFKSSHVVGDVNFLPYNVDDVREKLDNVEERATADRSGVSFSDLMQKEDDRRRSGKQNERFTLRRKDGPSPWQAVKGQSS